MDAQILEFTHTAPPDTAQVHHIMFVKHAASDMWVCNIFLTYDDAHAMVGAEAPDKATALYLAKRVLQQHAGQDRGCSVEQFVVGNVEPLSTESWQRLFDAVDVENF